MITKIAGLQYVGYAKHLHIRVKDTMMKESYFKRYDDEIDGWLLLLSESEKKMYVSPPEETIAVYHTYRRASDPHTGEDFDEPVFLSDEPLSGEDLERALMGILAEAAYLYDEKDKENLLEVRKWVQKTRVQTMDLGDLAKRIDKRFGQEGDADGWEARTERRIIQLLTILQFEDKNFGFLIQDNSNNAFNAYFQDEPVKLENFKQVHLDLYKLSKDLDYYAQERMVPTLEEYDVEFWVL